MKKVISFALAAAALVATQGIAAEFPTKPVRFMIAFPPGSSTDIVGRLYTNKWTELWGQTVLADNRGGAGGTLAAGVAARAAPDGYTLLMHSSGYASNHQLYANLPYTTADFVDIGPLAMQPNVLVTPNGSAYKSVMDLINTAKAKPGSINFASAGVGSGTHMNLEKFKLATKVNLNHIPYKGSGEVLADIVGGRVDFYFAPISAAMGHIEGKRLRALAVSTIKRSGVLPNVPTIAESGVPKFDFSLWFGVWAPKGVPQPVINKVAAAIKTAANDRGVKERLASLGNDPMDMNPAQFAKFVREEIEDAKVIVKAAGIKAQ
ncbi:MAG: tripartite tricarboxylate transporter substrate-binding protein [Betaproteobacteria bacterium]|jgi:tripartite-type tricarboxylate transporter receptor subunit TctC|nr:tripartite tricarboxylate transporter substrate-binding protein [Betaproteobacteria bacterium]MDH4294087.1 tripartite tricarboxylate transporter substrate-binding protein [Betaproteobacteria bacterium]MDH5344059.1 tripartite tricarboxylate transporter substrate-binding protein [Betaproteobacteria bacterium]